MNSRSSVLVLVLLGCNPTLDQPPPQTWQSRPELESAILQELKRSDVPGAGLCILEDRQPTWCGGFGWADLDASIAVGPDTAFLTASISKVITTTTVLMELDADFGLDHDIAPQISFSARHPDYPNRPITMRQLLTHSAGISDNWEVINPWVTIGDSPTPLHEALQSYFDPTGADFDEEWNFTEPGPGDSREYSNMGFSLAAHVIEGRSGEFAALSMATVIEPLGMEHSSWHQADLDLDQVALPYKVQRGQFVSQGHYAFPDYPSGGLHASAPDLARFLGGWQEILDDRMAAEALRVHHQIDGLDQGLGWYWWDLDDERILGHNGGEEGISSEFGIRESDGRGFVVLMNGEGKRDTLPNLERLLLE